MDRAIQTAVVRADMAVSSYGGWICIAVALLIATLALIWSWRG